MLKIVTENFKPSTHSAGGSIK